ncbi:tRNA guanosine(34) transglycosylase Tgt [Gammaproteobacteria bacterium]|nr:tRNA guanosine(34) transglycosylase Tgt [Gammaproteobacteria bacterium]
MKFNLHNKSEFARRAELDFDRGKIQTPAFMPVGTNGTVKGLTNEDLLETGSEIILGNTFHLMLRPGDKSIRDLGGLHKFINWNKPILTDSGGFQVWSLGELSKITEEGVKFSSPYDGKKIFMTPEESIKIQENLGSDIVMVFDECTDYPASYEDAKKSMELSMRWAERCKVAHKSKSALFGIVQGGMYKDLREESLNKLIDIDFNGIALGGLSVGESKEEKNEILEFMSNKLPEDKPRYLMGVGTPEDIVEAVRYGIDMFDCVLPTRNARNGQLFTSEGVINIRNAEYKDSDDPIDKNCDGKVSQNYSRAYLNHLQRTNEMLGSMLATYHNIYYYQSLMRDIRNAIKDNLFAKFLKDFYNKRNLDMPDGPI